MAYVNKVRKGQIDENEAARKAAEEAAEENRYETSVRFKHQLNMLANS